MFKYCVLLCCIICVNGTIWLRHPGINGIIPDHVMIHHRHAWSASHLAPWYQTGPLDLYQDQGFLGNDYFYPSSGVLDYQYAMNIGGGVYRDYFPSVMGQYPLEGCGIGGFINVPIHTPGPSPVQQAIPQLLQPVNPVQHLKVVPQIPQAVDPMQHLKVVPQIPQPVSPVQHFKVIPQIPQAVDPIQHLKLDPVPVRTDTAIPLEGEF